jgi:hypothetical protein
VKPVPTRALFGAALLGLGLLTGAPAQAAVSVAIGEPGFYGRIDIGGMPAPQVIYPQPVIIAAPPQPIPRSPIYLRVPPGHAKNWARYCGRYDACGQPVYFVQDGWYHNEYAPRYREQRRGPPPGRGWDRDRDHDRGHGHGNGRGRD